MSLLDIHVLGSPVLRTETKPITTITDDIRRLASDMFETMRAARVTIRAMDLDGNIFEREATELLARAFQHEIDHLHGKLFIDYLSFLKRRGVMARWEDMKDKYPSQRRVLTAPVNAGAEQASGDENG